MYVYTISIYMNRRCQLDVVLLFGLSEGRCSYIYATCYNLDHSPRNGNLNLMVQIKFLNLFLYSSKQKQTFIGGTKL